MIPRPSGFTSNTHLPRHRRSISEEPFILPDSPYIFYIIHSYQAWSFFLAFLLLFSLLGAYFHYYQRSQLFLSNFYTIFRTTICCDIIISSCFFRTLCPITSLSFPPSFLFYSPSSRLAQVCSSSLSVLCEEIHSISRTVKYA
ncbi:hypothetical protein BDW75DRAFT_68961 [Aspergillus navahoensis]